MTQRYVVYNVESPRRVGKLVKDGPQQSDVLWLDTRSEQTLPNNHFRDIKPNETWLLKKQDAQVFELKTKVAAVKQSQPLVKVSAVKQPKVKAPAKTDEIAERMSGISTLSELKSLAKRNGVWEARYEDLKYGLAKMTVNNKLRNRAKTTAIKW